MSLIFMMNLVVGRMQKYWLGDTTTGLAGLKCAVSRNL